MEFIGLNLKNIVDNKSKVFADKGVMSPIDHFIMCHIFRDLIACVNEWHDRRPPIIHRFMINSIIPEINSLLIRNLKPNNIFAAINGNRIRFKLSDYGFGDLIPSDTLDIDSAKCMAPEVMRRMNDKISPKADVHSLGAIGEELDFDLQKYVSITL